MKTVGDFSKTSFNDFVSAIAGQPLVLLLSFKTVLYGGVKCLNNRIEKRSKRGLQPTH